MNRRPSHDIEAQFTYGGDTYRARGTVTPYDPGRCSGPPEDCYPPEGGEVEIDSIIGPEGLVIAPSDALVDAATQALVDEAEDCEWDGFDEEEARMNAREMSGEW